jgi:hypothetical protein
MRTSWVALIALAAAVPAASASAQRCDFTAERTATLSASGLQLARIEARSGSLRIEGKAGLTEIRARGTACASSRQLLDGIRLVSRRAGTEGEMIVEMPETDGMGNYSMALDLVIEVPESLGLDVTDSSGDLEIRNVGGLTLKDSSGEVEIADVRGSLDVDDSSGNVEVDGVRGDVRLRDSSGDVDVRNVTGSVLVENDSSGNLDFTDVGGDVEVANDSSGDIAVARVRGHFTVRRDSSGAIRSRDVAGAVSIPQRRR